MNRLRHPVVLTVLGAPWRREMRGWWCGMPSPAGKRGRLPTPASVDGGPFAPYLQNSVRLRRRPESGHPDSADGPWLSCRDFIKYLSNVVRSCGRRGNAAPFLPGKPKRLPIAISAVRMTANRVTGPKLRFAAQASSFQLGGLSITTGHLPTMSLLPMYVGAVDPRTGC